MYQCSLPLQHSIDIVNSRRLSYVRQTFVALPPSIGPGFAQMFVQFRSLSGDSGACQQPYDNAAVSVKWLLLS